MILSRLGKAVREQNWFAVVLEFVIVVSGVLLAFQVSTWSQQAAERAYARDILARLRTELVSLSEVRTPLLERQAEDSELLTEARAIVMEYGEADDLSEDHCFAISVSHSGVSRAPDGFPSLDELMSSGALESIESEELRYAAMELHAKRAAERANADERLMRVVNLMVAYPEAVQPVYVRDSESESGFRRRAVCDLEAMRADPSFRAALVENTFVKTVSAEWFQFLDEAIALLRETIETELDLPPAGTSEQADP